MEILSREEAKSLKTKKYFTGKKVCGLHIVENLNVIPTKENRTKSNKWEEK